MQAVIYVAALYKIDDEFQIQEFEQECSDCLNDMGVEKADSGMEEYMVDGKCWNWSSEDGFVSFIDGRIYYGDDRPDLSFLGHPIHKHKRLG